MRLLLIRHGETVDNVAQNYAGSKDSQLTSHGMLQAKRLGQWVATNFEAPTNIFSSNLQRAFLTAESIRLAQHSDVSANLETVQLPELQEKDFGLLEGAPYRRKSGELLYHTLSDEMETNEHLRQRIQKFIERYLLPLLRSDMRGDHKTVVVVSHGLALRALWRVLSSGMNGTQDITAQVGLDLTQENGDQGKWSNTGVWSMLLELCHQPLDELEHYLNENVAPSSGTPVGSLERLFIHVTAVNSTEHLATLTRTKGGIGSAAYDQTQKTLENFFPRQSPAS
ncbi:MAG: hypothetical protein M1814_002165 [Vezdaea aestivalis]|nr:MAG: hypothetical protein M1814_002165 [Vezdaea aestivalis]